MSVIVKTPAEIAIMAEGGRRLVAILKEIKNQAVPGVTLKTLDEVARAKAEEYKGRPSFLDYRGYPAAICTSVNAGIVHCIPDEYALQEGDLLSLDFGFYYQGFHTDSAVSWVIGKDINHHLPLLRGTYAALRAGVAKIKEGVKVGEISQTIEQTLKANKLTIMRQFVGHGVGRELHEAPTIPNFVGPDKNVVLPAGSVVAIEPIAGIGQEKFITGEDHWSTQTTDRKPVAHFEETVAVTEGGGQILTPLKEILGFTP